MVEQHFLPGQLILRDLLAVDRTRLSNERTLLSYLRAGLTMIIAGVSGYNIFQNVYMRLAGLVFMLGGLTLVVYGVYRYVRMDRRLKKIASPEQMDTFACHIGPEEGPVEVSGQHE